jgi:hypothetical protein
MSKNGIQASANRDGIEAQKQQKMQDDQIKYLPRVFGSMVLKTGTGRGGGVGGGGGA